MTDEVVGRALREPALVSDQAPAGLDPSGFDPARILGRWRTSFQEWLRKRRHVHEFHDWYVFDSSADVSRIDPRKYRVVAQQIMTLCACGRTDRKHLETWADAEAARRRLPYIPWGVMVHRAPLPAALRDSDQSGEAGQTAQQARPEGRERGPKASPETSSESNQ